MIDAIDLKIRRQHVKIRRLLAQEVKLMPVYHNRRKKKGAKKHG